MKILNVEQIRALDAHTIKHEPIASIDLMERASIAFVNWFSPKFGTEKRIIICCGTGNNGGDGLAVARLLFEKGYHVDINIVGDSKKGSKDFIKNLQRLPFEVCHDPIINNYDVIIDAIFGTGLTRTVKGLIADTITTINQSEALTISIDIPSGLFADKHTQSENIIEANHTVSFQLPKLAFMFPEAYQYVGDWYVVDIGLDTAHIYNETSDFEFLMPNDISKLIKKPSKFDHKGSNGHALLVAGSYGNMGAAVLASRACLRAGVGLLSVHVPKGGNDLIQSAVPEAMSIPDQSDEIISECKVTDRYNGVGVGPGIGLEKSTVRAVENLLTKSEAPLVIDADALNIISYNRTFLELLPKNTILTPHPKEFERLVGVSWKNDFDRLSLQLEWSQKLGVIIVLKGAHTSITTPDGKVYFNSTGNEGMAKGGSGDVLLGMITSILVQGYSPIHAAIVGVYLHGLAGDIAAGKVGKHSMIAGDLIENIPLAYLQLLTNC